MAGGGFGNPGSTIDQRNPALAGFESGGSKTPPQPNAMVSGELAPCDSLCRFNMTGSHRDLCGYYDTGSRRYRQACGAMMPVIGTTSPADTSRRHRRQP